MLRLAAMDLLQIFRAPKYRIAILQMQLYAEMGLPKQYITTMQK